MSEAIENGKSISAVICTRNRSAALLRCLKALERQTLSSQEYEVIIVDNGSSDPTPKVAASCCERHVNFRYFREEKAGLAIARNAGVRLCSAQIVAFTDDDAEPDPSWLERMLCRFREHSHDVALVGGDVLPVWEVQRPTWLDDSLLRPLSAGLKWSTEPRFLRADEWLLECNFAYRRAVLLQVGGFPEHLGRVGDLLLSGEGANMLLMRRAGYRLYYDPEVLVRHHIPASRLTKKWFRRRSFWQGVSVNLLHQYVEETARKLGLAEPVCRARVWEEIPIPISAAAWADLFDDRSTDDFTDQLCRLEQLGYLLQSQSVVIGR